MTAARVRGAVYRCPVCGSEIGVLARAHGGGFAPRCCNVAMAITARRLVFYVCPVCGSEIGVIRAGGSGFRPRCCNVAMEREAA